MSNSEIAVFAETTFRNQRKKFGIKSDDRRRHMYLIGKTGMGKSTVLENMIIDDIRAGRGVAVVDPHGDLAEKVMAYIPEERIKDVIYFNPADIDYPIAFNVVEQVDSRLQHLVASGLIGVFQKLWADSWGPRLEYILRNAILAILDYPGSTLLGVVRMLSDKPYRKRVVANIKDPVVKAFWENEFTGYADKFASEAVSPIQNKVGQFLSSSLMRNIVGQIKSSIDLREVMDTGKILILNLSKGRIGEDNSALLGAMMITKIQLAAMSRVDIPEEQRRDFYLYIDEFQNFSTDSFANILSEARKYRLNLILAHQYIEQLNEKVKPAVFGNVGTMIAFRVGASDAEELAREFLPTFNEEDLVNLPKYEMYLKLMIDGVASTPFSARGLPPLSKVERTGQEEAAINWSRDHYATPREEVEEQIVRWYQANAEETALNEQRIIRERAVHASPRPKETSTPEGFPSICALCGTTTYTPFEPDGVRPVFCKQCLSKKKEERRQELEQKAPPINTPKLSVSAPQSAPPLAPAPRSPRRPAAAPVKNKAVNYQKASTGTAPAKKSNPMKVRPFTPSAMEPFADQSASGPALSLSDLAQAALRDFKGQPQKPTEKPASASLKKSSYLDSPILDKWPSGEDLEAGEEIDFTKK
ncbi:MAG: type IV secretion system DNA-binding domain-containing protein [Candidatus Parcubacteria bacterium]|nr:MAG: hypothetical protein JST_5330 [Candidatus Parcubacteria bacterium]